MNERNCETCIHARPFGGSNDNRCGAWECEYISRAEAIEAYETLKAMRDIGELYGKVKAVNVNIGE